MSSKPPMSSSHTSTKYEDLPPRFRKVWIEGNAERVQKKLDASIERFTFSIPSHQSSSDTNLPENLEVRKSRSTAIGNSERFYSSSSSLPPMHKRLRTNEGSLSELADRGGEPLENGKEPAPTPITYKGATSIKQIIDSVVIENIKRSTPPASRSTSPSDPLNTQGRYRPSSLSRPSTRASSPAAVSVTRPITPNPAGWIPLTSRHSLRRFENRPWGPRHLEYDYNEARKEFQGAAYYALGKYGYIPPKGVVRFKAPPPEVLPSMSDLRKVPEFMKACKRLDTADQALEEALARGDTWDNTPIPDEYLKLSLEYLEPEEFRRERPNNTSERDRKRSSVELEEAADQVKTLPLSQSPTMSASASTSAGENPEEANDSGSASSSKKDKIAQVTLLEDKQPRSRTISRRPSFNTTPALASTQTEISPLQLLRKRLLEEMQNDHDAGKSSNGVSETSKLSSPAPTPPLSGQATPIRLTRSHSRSGSTGSGSSSGSGDGEIGPESSSTSASTNTSATRRTRSSLPLRRASRMRAVKSRT